MIDFAGDPRGVQLQLLIERLKYERHVGNAVDALLDREFSRLLDLLLSAKYRDLTAAQRQRAAQLFAEVGKRLGAGYRDVSTLVLKEMQGYAQLEAEVTRAQAVGTLGTAAEVSITISASLPTA